ncbi:hypothetical protein [uncultured Roseibium sp.]|uniref:hypothetical protein n=1 Tax=uncultured Roseibium sp. TaxID=1936171 RepID=UPI002626C1A3|nr:hypothetical protein [uncultured Roseibium sp.]
MYKEMKKSFNFYNKPFGGNDAFRFVFGIFKRLTKAEKKYSEKKNVMGRTYYFLEFLKGEDGLASIKEDHFLFEFANNLLEMPETALFDIVNNAFGIQFVD